MSQPTPQCNHNRFFICSLCWEGDDFPPSSTMGSETMESLLSSPAKGTTQQNDAVDVARKEKGYDKFQEGPGSTK